MSTNQPESLVTVYSTPVEFDAEIVKAMLADIDIPSTVENANAPFPGIGASPCQVMVSSEHEAEARKLVEEHEARLRLREGHDTDEYVYDDTEEGREVV